MARSPLPLILLATVSSTAPLGGCTGVTVETDWVDEDSGDVDTSPLLVITPTLTWDVDTADGTTVRTLQIDNPSDLTRSVIGFEVTPDEGSEGAFSVVPPAGQSLPLIVTIPPRSTLSLDVAFAPPHGGSFGATLSVRADRDENPEDIVLVGEATGPELGLSVPGDVPKSLQYCPVPITVTVTNRGNDVLPVDEVRLGSSPGCASFQLRPDEVEALQTTPIAPDGSADLVLDFVPVLSAGGSQTCRLFVDSDALPQPSSVLLEGLGGTNRTEQEDFRTSDGSGAHVLVLFDDAAVDLNTHRDKLISGLPTLLESMSIEGIDYRIAAASTADACTVTSPAYGVASEDPTVVAERLRTNLFTEGTTWAYRPMALLDRVLGTNLTACFGGWLRGPDPLHVLIISARDDSSAEADAEVYLERARAVHPDLTVSTISPQGTCGPSTPRLDGVVEASGGVLYDLCDDRWDGTWFALATQTAELRKPTSAFSLAAQPLLDSLRVEVDGEASEDWTFEAATRTVSLTGPVDDDSLVRVSYVDERSCE